MQFCYIFILKLSIFEKKLLNLNALQFYFVDLSFVAILKIMDIDGGEKIIIADIADGLENFSTL